jgi:hypothetical protein
MICQSARTIAMGTTARWKRCTASCAWRGRPSRPTSAARCGGSGSGTSASGTDDNLPYDVGGDELGRAKEQIRIADAEADKIVDAIGDDAAVDAAANDMHHYLKQADLHLENYTASVIDNPEGKARREISRAFAQTILAGYGAGRA